MEADLYNEDEWWHETREAAQKALDAANAAWDPDPDKCGENLPVPNGAVVRAEKLNGDPCWAVVDEYSEYMVGNLDPVWCLVV